MEFCRKVADILYLPDSVDFANKLAKLMAK